jgi:hypothetical protein
MRKLLLTALVASIVSLANAQLKINEALAKNNAVDTSELGKKDDWIEIYNMGSSPVDIADYYISDQPSVPTLYRIPSGFAFTVIPAGGFRRIWCDDTTTFAGATQIHAPFKLSSNGETLKLSDESGDLIDQITFGTQVDNISYGRCPDGSSNFTTFTTPTPEYGNCQSSGLNDIHEFLVRIYPNPSSDVLIIESNGNTFEVEIYNAIGGKVFTGSGNISYRIQTSDFPQGGYFIRTNTEVSLLSRTFQVLH